MQQRMAFLSISLSSEEGQCSGSIEGRAAYLNDSIATYTNGICGLRFHFRNSDSISLVSTNCKTADSSCSFSDQYHRAQVGEADSDFEGIYRVGTTTCTISPSKMSYELKWEKGSEPIHFFYKSDGGNGEKILMEKMVTASDETRF